MNVVDSYKSYLANPNPQTIRDFFRSAVDSKEDQSSELFDLHYNHEPNKIGDWEISTGGSTATPNTYQVGPYFFETREVIENFLRSPEHPEWPRLYVRGLFPSEMGRIFWGTVPPPDSIAVDLTRQDFGRKLILAIQTNIDRHGGCCIYTFCRTAQPMSQCNYLLNYLESVRDKVILSTSYADAFYNTKPFLERGIYCNDQMINWHSGLTFYTCRHNRRHVIQNLRAIDGNRMYNLFNPNHKVSAAIDDLVEYDDAQCECGRGFMVKRFVPHVSVSSRYPDGTILHDLSLAEKFDSPWYTMQLLTKDDGKLYCYYIAEEEPNKRIIEEHFGLPVEMVRNSMFRRRGKAPIFWGKPEMLTEYVENII